MSTEFTLVTFANATGEIRAVSYHSCEESHKPGVLDLARTHWGDSFTVLETGGTIEPQQNYVVMLDSGPVILDRPDLPYAVDKTVILADGEDAATISGLSDPSDVVIDDPDPMSETITATVTGGSFEFSADVPGLYTIQIARFPFLPLTLEIIAVDISASPDAGFSEDFSFEFG